LLPRRSFLFLLGPAPWVSKLPDEWDDADMRLLLTRSPWARTVRIPSRGPDVGPVGGTIPGVVDACCSLGRGVGGGVARDTPFVQAVILWQSARPVRLALARLHGARFDDCPVDEYLLAVLLPGGVGALKPELTLSWRDHKKILPIATTPPAKDGQAWLFRFAKSPLIRLEDGSVTAELRLGAYHIRTRFKLAAMVHSGRLEL